MSASIASIVEPIIQREAGGGLRHLLALREERPDAGPKLARYLGSTQLVTQRIKLAYDVSEIQPPFNSARHAIEESGYRGVHSSAVACLTVDALELEQTWPSEGPFWVWTCSHSLMSMVMAEGAPQHRDMAFAGTFLRNVGHLLIKQQLASEHGPIARAVTQGATAVEAERSILGFTHLDVMREVAEAWQLDQELLHAFEEFPERGSIGRLFWKAKRTLHRLGLSDPSGPMEVTGAPLHPELAQFIGSVGGVRGLVRLASPFLASAFVSADAQPDSVIEELLAA
jgi:HDOD domain-containing protein